MFSSICSQDSGPISVKIKGLVSKFAVGCGRTGTDRQFFYVNGRPCNIPTVRLCYSFSFSLSRLRSQIQKAFNEVYRSFNANQAPFIVADFVLPKGVFCCSQNLHLKLRYITLDAYDVNVSPDKRTILIHHEGSLITELKVKTQLLSSRFHFHFLHPRQPWSLISPLHDLRTT